MIGPAVNPHEDVKNRAEQQIREINYTNSESLESSLAGIHKNIESHGYCVLRYTGNSSFDEDMMLQSLPYMAEAAQIADTWSYNAVGGNVQRNVVEGGNVRANEVLPFCSPAVEVHPHHELLFTPMKPDRLGFILQEGTTGATTIFDGIVALDFLHYSPTVDWDTKCALLKKVYCDRLVYRRRYVSPETSASSSGIENMANGNSWGVLFGDVDIYTAVELAEQQGYEATAGENGTELLLDFGHSLICQETGALNNNTAADRSLFEEGMIWWESDGAPITDQEHWLLGEAYQQARIPFSWQAPGDALLLDNRRVAHGREAYNGEPRRLFQLLGNLIAE